MHNITVVESQLASLIYLYKMQNKLIKTNKTPYFVLYIM